MPLSEPCLDVVEGTVAAGAFLERMLRGLEEYAPPKSVRAYGLAPDAR